MIFPSRLVATIAGLTVAGSLAGLSWHRHNEGPASKIAQAAPSDPTAALLVELIRVNTSNPPGNEGGIATLLAPRFRALGFEVDIVQTPDSGKAHFIARLRGNGSKRPVLIAAHADVVGVEREKWTVDPFAGVVKDGYVFGRGAIDFKGGMAVFARAAMMLAEQKVPLDRDVIFLAEADEENGKYSTSWLASQAWDKIDCEFALNEGGWIMKGPDGRVRYVSISTADKGAVQILLTAKGTSTHSSMPRPDNAIFSLARALTKLSSYETPVTLIPSTRQFFTTLAKTSQPPMSGYFRDIASGDSARVRAADREISKDPLLHALLRNTLAPVLMNAGFRGNVIPGSAEATVNARLIPGTDPNDIVRDITRVIDDPTIDVRTASLNAFASGAAPSSEDTDLYRALVKSARQEFSAEVTPYLFQAGTDAPTWRRRGIPVYGIYPYPIDADDLARMHGNDERVRIESLRQGTEMIYRTLVDVAGRH
jgi:acetylornithine deacetylase/succinyl-diaminopimelate desuccinylase-like protein